jgi:hypothetical protein
MDSANAERGAVDIEFKAVRPDMECAADFVLFARAGVMRAGNRSPKNHSSGTEANTGGRA